MTIAELNCLDRQAFVEAVGWVFEHSPWVAERAWSFRPFADAQALHAAMTDEVRRASEAEQLALLRAHPDLGTRARLTRASGNEQAGAGLDSLSRAEFDLLQELNADYRNRFGFPFLLAVKGSSKYDILRALHARMEVSPQQEFREALNQVYRIAAFRIADTVTEG